MALLSPELIQALVAGFTFLGGVWLAWWRITARVHGFIGAQAATSFSLDTLNKSVLDLADETTDKLDDLSIVVTTLTAQMAEREKDVSRLEGQIEQLGTLIVKQVAAVNGAVASLDAVWRTLQVLHPDKVPRRASDRG